MVVYGPSSADTANGVLDPATGAWTPQDANSTAMASSNPNAGMDPLTGFASRYQPSLANQAFENPWYILQDVFKGINPSDPGYQSLRDLGGDPLTLYNIAQGSQQKLPQGADTFINWLAKMYENQGTVGGKGFDADQLIKTLFGQTEFGDKSKNTLGQVLGAGDMSTQVRTLFNMLRDVSNVGMDPLGARGYQAAVAQAGDSYGNAQMQSNAGDTQNVTEWIAKNRPWLAGR